MICCLSSVLCQDPYYIGQKNGNHIYYYNGREYQVPDILHRGFLSNPEAARQRFLAQIAEPNSRFDTNSGRPQVQQRPNYAGQTQGNQQFFAPNQGVNQGSFDQRQDSDIEAQTFNRFEPSNRNKDSSAVTFPQIQGFRPAKPAVGLSNVPQRNEENSPFGSDVPLTQSTGYSVAIPKRDETDRGNRAISEFAWQLFKGSNSQADYVLSPLSPQILLSYLAWVADGKTRDEIVYASSFGSPQNILKTVDSLLSEGAKRELQIATAFFVSKDMK